MASYKVAYGPKEKVSASIAGGIIPPGTIILTEDSSEILFYSLERELNTYKEKSKFTSLEEAQDWVDKNECSGQIFSVHHDGKCNIYVVNYDNKLEPITSTDYVKSDRNPTDSDNEYDLCTHWLNVFTNQAFILVNILEEKAIWQELSAGTSNGVTSTSDSNYVHSQNQASKIWSVHHNLNKFPSVSIVDSSGNAVVGDITYIDNNNLTVKFSSAFSGKAYIN